MSGASARAIVGLAVIAAGAWYLAAVASGTLLAAENGAGVKAAEPGAAIVKPAAAGRSVVLKLPAGRFLRATGEGSLRPERRFPTEQETFQLLPRDGGAIALKAPGGRFLTACGYDARTLRADSPRSEPGERETFVLVPLDGNRAGMKVRGLRDFILFAPDAREVPPAGPKPPEKPAAGEIVEIYEVAEVPESIRSMLAAAVRTLVAEELADKEYNKVRSRQKEKFLDLPAPTKKDLLRTKPRRVLSVTEEYQVRARLAGPMEIEIKHMPYLKGYRQRDQARLMFVVHAGIPVRGHVRYTIPDVLGASTGFRTTERLALVGELAARKSGDELSLDPPEVLELHVELRRLDLSNDVLQSWREPIEELVNRELRHNEERIRSQANKSLAKAFQARQLHSPLLRYLALP